MHVAIVRVLWHVCYAGGQSVVIDKVCASQPMKPLHWGLLAHRQKACLPGCDCLVTHVSDIYMAPFEHLFKPFLNPESLNPESPCIGLQASTTLLRSPSEYESTPAVSALMQSYFLKLLSHYRDFMEPDVEQPQQPHHAHHGSAPVLSQRSMGAVDDDADYLR